MYLTVLNRDTGETTPMYVLESRGFYYAHKSEYDRVCALLEVPQGPNFLLLGLAPNQPTSTVRIFSQKEFLGNIYTTILKD